MEDKVMLTPQGPDRPTEENKEVLQKIVLGVLSLIVGIGIFLFESSQTNMRLDINETKGGLNALSIVVSAQGATKDEVLRRLDRIDSALERVELNQSKER